MRYEFHLNKLRIAPRKTRQIAALIRGLSVEEAETQLKFQSQRAALPILKLLKSGAAAAVNNFNLAPENLYIYNIFVDEGPMLKRFRPRAFGRAGAIHKKTSHVTLVLEERIMPGAKKKRKIVKEIKPEIEKETVKEKKPSAAPKEIKPKQKVGGFVRRIFRRKAIG